MIEEAFVNQGRVEGLGDELPFLPAALELPRHSGKLHPMRPGTQICFGKTPQRLQVPKYHSIGFHKPLITGLLLSTLN